MNFKYMKLANRPRLGYKLWYRNKKQKGIKWIKTRNGSEIFALLLTLIGIWIGVKANQLTSYGIQLTESDTRQDSQLIKLEGIVSNQKTQLDTLVEILKGIREQNQLTQGSNQDLSRIVTQSGLQSSISAELYKTANIQSTTVEQQLTLLKRQESKLAADDSLERLANMQSLFTTFDKLIDIDFFSQAIAVRWMPLQNQLPVVRKTKTLLSEQISNKFFLTDTTVRTLWFSLYNFTGVYEERLAVEIKSETHTPKELAEFKQKAEDFSSLFMVCTNALRKSKQAFFNKLSNSLPSKVVFPK